jgi:microcystin-dependent protein
VGEISIWGTNTAPSKTLFLRGQAISRSTYAALFALWGTTYGVGDGTTTFNVPDTQGYFIRGFDAASVVDPSRVFGSTQTDAFQGHGHEIFGGINAAGGEQGIRNDGNFGPSSAVESTWEQVREPIEATNGVPRIADETRPVNIALNFIVYTGV